MSDVIDISARGGVIPAMTELTPNPKVVEVLEKALDDARAGRMTAVAFVGFGLREPVHFSRRFGEQVHATIMEAEWLVGMLEYAKQRIVQRILDDE